MKHFVILASIGIFWLVNNASAAVQIATLDSTRQGSEANLINGTASDEFRAELAADLPGSIVNTAPSLSASFLSGKNLVILGVSAHGSQAITPLTATEQTALYNFVLGGGSALLFVDNDSYSGMPTSDVANESFISPFGLHATGTFAGSVGGTLLPATPLSQGPFGIVTTATYWYCGEIDNLGPYALSAGYVGADPSQVSVAYIPRGALGSGSGAVVVITDSLNWDFGFSQNQTLVRNAVAFTVPEPASALLLSGGVFFTLLHRKRATR